MGRTLPFAPIALKSGRIRAALTDALHDLADPLAALRSMRDQLEPESGVIVVLGHEGSDT